MQENEKSLLEPGMSLTMKDGSFRIFRSTIVALGTPKFVRLLLNPDNRSMAVQGMQSQTSECFRVPVYTPDNWDFKIHSTNFLKNIWEICEWDQEATYRVQGTFDEVPNMILFDLSQAKKLDILQRQYALDYSGKDKNKTFQNLEG